MTGRVLITGARSLLGQAVIREMAMAGWDVHVLARLESDLSALRDDVTVHRLDDRESAASVADGVAVAGADVILHLAGWYVREHNGPEQLERLRRANLDFGLAVLDAAATHGPKAIVTAASYFEHMRGRDDDEPVNLYAAFKQAFAGLLTHYVETHGLTWATLVIYDLYGPGDGRGKLIPVLLDKARTGEAVTLADPAMPMDPVHVSDAARAFRMAAEALVSGEGAVTNRRFAVRSAAPPTIGGIVETVERVTGKALNVSDTAWPTPARHVEALWPGPALPGWQAEITLEDGIRELWETAT